ncbi:MAG: undecaprenyl-diphosphatase UppP [Chloroflexota bacterium]|nr:undecaprenyl-diphosphatase UppP [Chloroflexota bacterium]
MDLIQAIILGLVQGLSEFIPISSSAHLIIVPWLLGWQDPGITFDVALHMGTLVAVLAYFWQDWLRLITGALRSLRAGHPLSDPEGRLGWFILIATIPGALAGLLGESKLDELFHGSSAAGARNGILIIGIVMIVLALVLLAAERIARHQYDMEHLTLAQAVTIGLAQATAIIPGVSRSGSTITAGLFMNLKREAAARFSFLLGTPVIVGASVKKAYDLFKPHGTPVPDPTLFAVGMIVAAVSGYAAIWLLLRFLQRNTTLPFIIYRVAMGVLLIVLVLAGFRQ